VLTGLDALRADMRLAAPYVPRHRLWEVVVADEAQLIKNAHTAIAATIKVLAPSPRLGIDWHALETAPTMQCRSSNLWPQVCVILLK
jgi:hypothetical protein